MINTYIVNMAAYIRAVQLVTELNYNYTMLISITITVQFFTKITLLFIEFWGNRFQLFSMSCLLFSHSPTQPRNTTRRWRIQSWSQGGVPSDTFKWLAKVGASKCIIRVDLKKIMAGGGFRATRNPPQIRHCSVPQCCNI